MADTLVVTVAGTERDTLFDSFSIAATINGIDTLSCEFDDDGLSSPMFRPSLGQEVIVRDTSVSPAEVLFGGNITYARERGHGGPNLPSIVTAVTASDYGLSTLRRTVSATITVGSPGTALETFLTTLVADYLSEFGISLHPSQATGPSLPALAFDDVTVRKVLDQLSEATGWVWNIDYEGQLRMWSPGDVLAPFNITEDDSPAQWQGDVEVERTRGENYANRIVLVGETIVEKDRVERFTEDGSPSEFTPEYQILGVPAGVLKVTNIPGLADGDVRWETINAEGNTNPSTWKFDTTTNTISRTGERSDGTLPTGAFVDLIFDGEFTPRYTAEDLAEQAIHGVWERVVRATGVTSAAAAQEMAEALLAEALAASETRIRYQTRELGVLPGQRQTITAPSRNVTGDFLITDVVTKPEPGGDGLIREVHADLTSFHNENWRKTWRDFLEFGGDGPINFLSDTDNDTNGGQSGQSGVLVATATIDHTAILAGTPVTLVPGPGVGYALVPVYFQNSRDFLAVYTSGSPGADTDLNPRLCYTDSTKPVSNSDSSPGPSETTGYSLRYIPDDDFTVAQVNNAPLVVTWAAVDGGGAGANVMRASCAYYIVPVAESDAPALVTSTSAAAAGGADSVSTGAIDTTGANFIAVAVSHFGGSLTMSDSKGNSYTELLHPTTADAKAYLFYCADATVGTGHTFTATSANDSVFPAIVVGAFRNVATTSPADVTDTTTNLSAGSVVAGPVTPNQHASLIVTMLGTGGGIASVTGGDSFTEVAFVDQSGGNNMGVGMAYQYQETAAAISATWTLDATESLASGIAAFKPLT